MRPQSLIDAMEGFVSAHKELGHEAVFTQIAAPGTGRGTYCYTCKEHGPNTARILSPEEVR